MDIDLDLKTDFDPKEIFDVVRASMVKDNDLVKHNVGVYFHICCTEYVSKDTCEACIYHL